MEISKIGKYTKTVYYVEQLFENGNTSITPLQNSIEEATALISLLGKHQVKTRLIKSVVIVTNSYENEEFTL